jgi:hypothetical protein
MLTESASSSATTRASTPRSANSLANDCMAAVHGVALKRLHRPVIGIIQE